MRLDASLVVLASSLTLALGGRSQSARAPAAVKVPPPNVITPEKWLQAMRWFTAWAKVNVPNTWNSTTIKPPPHFIDLFQDSLAVVWPHHEYNPKPCNVDTVGSCAPGSLSVANATDDQLNAWRINWGLSNINDYYARQIKYLDQSMTDVLLTTFDSVYNAIGRGDIPEKSVRPPMSYASVRNLMQSMTGWVQQGADANLVARKEDAAAVERTVKELLNDKSKNRVILEKYLKEDRRLYDAIFNQKDLVDIARSQTVVKRLGPDFDVGSGVWSEFSYSRNTELRTFVDKHTGQLDSLDDLKRKARRDAEHTADKLAEQLARAPTAAEQAKLRTAAADKIAAYSKLAFSALSNVLGTASFVIDLMEMLQPHMDPKVPGAEYKAQMGKLWRQMKGSLLARHAQVFNTNPFAENGLYDMLSSGKFIRQKKVDVAAKLNGWSEWISGFSVQMFMRERYMFFLVYEAGRYGRGDRCDYFGQFNNHGMFCWGGDRKILVQVVNAAYEHSGWRSDPISGGSQEIKDVDSAIRSRGLDLHAIFMSSWECQRAMFADYQTDGHPQDRRITENPVDGEGRTRAPWNWISKSNGDDVTKLAAKYGDWLYSSPGVSPQAWNGTVSATTCAFNIPVVETRTGPGQFSYDDDDNGWWDYAKRYGAAMVFALVGNANKVHAMRFPEPFKTMSVGYA